MPLIDGMAALVTGSGSQIGQAACHVYARRDAREVDSDTNEKEGNKTEKTIRGIDADKSSFISGR